MSQWCNDGKEIGSKQRHAPAKLLFVNINTLFFAVLLDVAVVVGFVVIQKQCYHGNVTSYFSSQPRPQGFSIKKWEKEKPWGRGWYFLGVTILLYRTYLGIAHLVVCVTCHSGFSTLYIYICLLFFQPLAFLNLLYNTSTPSFHSVVCRYDILLASVVKGSSYRLRAVSLFLQIQ